MQPTATISVVHGPEGARLSGAPLNRCRGLRGSETLHRVELAYGDGQPYVISILPRDAFAACLDESLGAFTLDAYSGPALLEVVGAQGS